MVSNSINNYKTNNNISHQLIEHKKTMTTYDVGNKKYGRLKLVNEIPVCSLQTATSICISP